MDCLTPLALSGALTLSPPDVHPTQALDGKATYGTPDGDHLTTDNFVIVHYGAGAKAERAAEALEATWTALVDEQGWTPPVSSDDYLVWVVFDSGLSGTGVTTEHTSGEFPQGYPVIYLNPAYANDQDFWAHLASHEFAHTLQFAARDDWTWTPDEAWFWEASGEWMVERALPDLDVYAWQVSWYSRYPWYRFDALEDQHQYGMGVFVAYLDEHVWGDDGLRDAWARSGDGRPWLEVLGETAPVDELWSGFAAQVANGGLRESDRYEPVRVDAVLSASSGEVAQLGTDYFEASARGSVTASGDVVLSSPHGTGPTVNVDEGDVVGVTGLDPATAPYSLTLGEWVPEPMDSDSMDTATPRPFDPEGPRRCGCASSSALWLGGGWLVAVALLRRRE